MIKFINDKLLIVHPCGQECFSTGYSDHVESLKGELFDRDEVISMIKDLYELIKLKKDMKERGHTRCDILTKQICCMKGIEDDGLAACNNMPVREISLDTLTTFIDSIPTIARWL